MREHQLSAILFTDIIGYSKQMASDQAKTLDALQRNKGNHQRIVGLYHGRIIDMIGDGHLCLFSSSLDAVYAGLALQHNLQASGDQTQLRIGVHVGDTVIERRGLRVVRVVGDTVNIASRIESNAPGPGVWVSVRVASDLRSHRYLTLESAGEFNLKNIAEPMEIFEVTAAPDSLPAVQPRMHFTYRHQHISRTPVVMIGSLVLFLAIGAYVASQIFDTPESLAVLPMEYVGADDDYQYLASAFWTRLQTHLSPIPNVKLTSQANARRLTESREYIGDQEVDYFMEGTVILENQQVTIEVRLVEADEDTILYTQQWQGSLEQLDAMEQEALADIADYLVATF
jgi:class 3 adenylate cyclase/TolB-like protein